MKPRPTFRALFLMGIGLVGALATKGADSPSPPYPLSAHITAVSWDWSSRRTAAPGSDLWPTAWGADDRLYAAWGDGGGFGGTDSDGRVSMGFAWIEGAPESYRAGNINGGKNPEHQGSFPKKGKTSGLTSVDGVLYALVNLQDGKWPEVNHALEWSSDRGATWTSADWIFPKGAGYFQPARFLAFGRDYNDVPTPLAGYVYIIGPKRVSEASDGKLYLARAPRKALRDHTAYEYFGGAEVGGTPAWTSDASQARPVFADPQGASPAGMVYCPGLRRFLLSTYHSGPGQLGLFEAASPWGPWSTVAYYENWGDMGGAGEGLSCEFPQKWMNADGSSMWCVFSVYGDGAKQGIRAHDCFNLVRVALTAAK